MKNYEIRRTPDDKPNWFFQVFNNKLVNLSARGPFNIIAVCDSGVPEQVVFSIPYAYLKAHILPYAYLEANGRYLFNINKKTYEFNWSRNVKMDGKKFLVT
ncbi:MAG: hypothetical protein ACREOO_28590 [bacterium]